MHPQRVDAEHVHAGVDLTDAALGVGGVLLLDDAQHVAGRVTDDATVSGRVIEERAHDGDPRGALAVGGDQRRERVRLQQRNIAAEDHDVAVEVGEGVEGDLDGAPRARHVVLVDHDRVRGLFGDLGGDEVPLVAHHRHHARGLQGLRGGEHVAHERAAADAVQNLGCRRPHPRALAGGEDDDGQGCVGIHHAPPPGLEPRPHSSKGCRAAITPRRTAAVSGRSPSLPAFPLGNRRVLSP